MSRFGPIVLKRPRNQMLLTCLTWALGVSTATDKHPSICPFELGKSHQRKSSKLCDEPQQLGCGGQASKSRFHSALDAGRFCLQWESSCCHEGCLGEGALGDGFFRMISVLAFYFFVFTPSKRDVFPYKRHGLSIPGWLKNADASSAGMARWPRWVVDGGNFSAIVECPEMSRSCVDL